MDEEFLESGATGNIVTPDEMDIMFSYVSGAAKDGYQEKHPNRSVR